MHFGITGGAGFIGTNLARLLLDQGHKVTILDDLSTGLQSNIVNLDIEFIENSIADLGCVISFAKSVDFIFHLGARGSVPRSLENPQATWEVNSLGTFHVLEAARFAGIPVLFSSSSSVYGDNPLIPKNETHRLSPITPYAASKAAAEAFAYAYAKSYQMNISIVRFFNVFGPYQRPDHVYAAVIPKWIWAALKDEELVIYGDGETTRDFTFVDTVTSALYEFSRITEPRSLPVNLAFGKPVSLNLVISELKSFFPRLRVRYEDERKGDLRASENDPKVLREVLPHLTEIEFKEGLNRTVSWLQNKFKSESIDEGESV